MNHKMPNKLTTGLLCTLVLASVGVASAKTVSQYVDGGYWSYTYTPGVSISSSYYHGSKSHSTTVSVGSGPQHTARAVAGETARASAYGIGTTHVWYNTY